MSEVPLYRQDPSAGGSAAFACRGGRHDPHPGLAGGTPCDPRVLLWWDGNRSPVGVSECLEGLASQSSPAQLKMHARRLEGAASLHLAMGKRCCVLRKAAGTRHAASPNPCGQHHHHDHHQHEHRGRHEASAESESFLSLPILRHLPSGVAVFGEGGRPPEF